VHLEHGIGANRTQFAHQLLQVLLVGSTLGMMRTVVPALAEAEFGVPKGSFLLLVASSPDGCRSGSVASVCW
jgi:hypothetical protein